MAEKEQELQEKLILYQLLQRHLEELRQQALLIERKFLEVETTKQAMDDIKKLKDSNEILIPLGSGLYTHGRIIDPKKTLIDAGAGIFMDKKNEEAKISLEEKNKDIDKLANNLQQEMTDVVNKINHLAQEIEIESQKAKK